MLLYSFNAAGHGTVLEEATNHVLPSYLDLRFPASDIPAQARALYTANSIRIIPDANYAPVPLTGLPGEAADALDMSTCTLRSVSPVHLQYMRNMGTMASMSISILCEGRLWGLISIHHATPRLVPYLVRSACDMLTKIVASHLTAFRIASELRAALAYKDVQQQIFTQIAAENNYLGALGHQMALLMRVTAARGAVLAIDGRFHHAGNSLGTNDLRRIVEWLNDRPQMGLFETEHLALHLPWASRIAHVASGLLAVRISDIASRYILWLRPELLTTVEWAGEPIKVLDEAKSLHPRASFQSWKETLRGQSLPWTEVEIESAREFRAALTTIGLRRAEEEAALSEARFDRLTHLLPIKVFAVTDEGTLTYVNSRWKGQGFVSAGLWYEAMRLTPEHSARCAAAWHHAVTAGTAFEEEACLVSPEDGRDSWKLIRIVPYQREGASRAGWIGACIDLSERKQQETAIRIAEKLTLTGRMTSYIAHEINNPLCAITNTLYLLQQKIPLETDTAEDFATIHGELLRISSTVQQTLRWRKENSEDKTWIKAGILFEDVLKLFGAKIRNRATHVTIEGDQGIVVFGIVGQLRQVLTHLVSNALDATPSGGRVWMRIDRLGNDVEFLVGDAGEGMTEAEQSSLFQPFYSTKGDLGNGLGLYISKEIAERHQGQLAVESVKGQGTITRLRIPGPVDK